MMAGRSLSIAIALVFLLAHASAYKAGPPVGSVNGICTNMIPQHGVPPMATTSPISFKLSQSCFGPTQTVRIEVSASGDPIEGLFIQARTDSFPNATSSLGKFRAYVRHTATYNCFSGTQNALGHKDDEPKVQKMNVYWQAPNNLDKDILVGGTFVIHEKEFWVNQFVKIQYSADCQQMATGEAEEKDSGASANIVSMIVLSAVLFVHKLL